MLKEKLSQDQKDSLRAGDSQRRSVIGMVLSAIKNREFDKRAKLSKDITDVAELDKASLLNDEEIIEVISSEIKKRKDSISQFEAGGRPELAEGEKKEIEMLSPYMPEQIPEEELRNIVKETISESGATSIKDMGKVIGAIMPKVKGRADGQVVSQMVKEILS